MRLTRVFPTVETIDLDAADARERLVGLYALSQGDHVRLNLISSISGAATGADGTSETLSSPTDRLILKVIRSLADVVVVGAASVRAEGYFVPRSGALAIVSRSGDFSGHQIGGLDGRGRVVVLCPADAVERARGTIGQLDAEVIAVRDAHGSLDAVDIVEALRALGLRRIVAEGGPQLARLFVAGDVVDEFCLTTAPVINGAALPLFGGLELESHPLELRQLLLDEPGATYARWAVGAAASSNG